ncbi:MAG: ribose-phosphate diphosphokinase [Nanoarchaeota archaeon]|nr:ribose-phosphate diphosphokinase [Nanoarchaeota archaeon]
MLITSCGNSEKIAKAVAHALKVPYSPVHISAFPDGDLYLKFNTAVKGKTVVIINSFQPHSNDSLFKTIFAAETAKDLGAKKVILAAPYLAFMRQDIRFHPGEAISSKIMAKHLSMCIDKIITIDGHLHRYRTLDALFHIPGKDLTANPLIAEYIKKNSKKDTVIIGPDWESFQWAEKIAQKIGAPVTVFEKKRSSSRKVSEKMIKPIPLQGKHVIIVDDIISTGHTVIEAAKLAYAQGAKDVSTIAVHGLFVENGLAKLKKAKVNPIITTNCIEHGTNRIDVSPLLIEELKKEK